MKINFTVNSLEIYAEELPDIVDDSVNYLEACFTLNGDEWTENTVITAIFKNSTSAYSVMLDNGSCIVPTEVLREEKFRVGLCGSCTKNNVSKIFYTKEAVVPTEASCFSYTFDNGMTVPAQYNQIIEYLSYLLNKTTVVPNDAFVITKLESDSNVIYNLEDLDSGIYSLNGNYIAYDNSDSKLLENGLILLTASDSGYFAMIIDSDKILFYDYKNIDGEASLNSNIIDSSLFSQINNKVDKIDGKDLSSNDYTDEDKQKLAEIESGAQTNVIEKISVNGTETEISQKSVNIAVPTKTSDLQNDSGFTKARRFSNVLFSSDTFTADTTFSDYPYKADITLSGITANDYANVYFSLSDVQSKNYAPVCTTGENTVTIYAKEVPTSTNITIPLIEVIKV